MLSWCLNEDLNNTTFGTRRTLTITSREIKVLRRKTPLHLRYLEATSPRCATSSPTRESSDLIRLDFEFFFLAGRSSQKRWPRVASRGKAKGSLTTSERNRQKQIFAWGISQLYQHFQPLGKSHKKSSFFVSHQLTTNINKNDALSGLRLGLEEASLRMKGSLVPLPPFSKKAFLPKKHAK